MNETINPAAPDHLPSFIAATDGGDPLMIFSAMLLVGGVIGFGALFFWLHSLPERMAHKSQKLQMELVAVLCLIALFTHMHVFWIAGLLLALIELPDISNPIGRVALSLERLADAAAPRPRAEPALETGPEPEPPAAQAEPRLRREGEV